MIACNRGDVVLVGFVFSDESGVKLRAAVVISSALTVAHDMSSLWQ